MRKEFKAKGNDGHEYVIIGTRPDIDVTDSGSQGYRETILGICKWELENGTPVNHVSKGKWVTRDQSMHFTSDDPNAP